MCDYQLINVMFVQVQLNLAKRAIMRLQKVLGIHPGFASPPLDGTRMTIDSSVTTVLLRQASVDKLRVIAEFLLDTLLGMTNSGATIPQIPSALYESFTPSFAASLFRSLCVHGTRKTQTHAGVLLVRVCSAQRWWGEFLGNMLQEFFASDQTATMFPQDR
jgi:baculoviral IAP repeat-containing protein 6 (apollon)